MTVPGWPEVFRGTAAVAAGLVTPDRLRGPGFERPLPDTYVPAADESPDLRLILVRRGLPRPVPQHPVVDDRKRLLWLDLAYPDQRLGVEYDGGDHFATPDAARADAQRHPRLVAAGWRVLRYTADELRHAPDRIVAEVSRALGESRRDADQRAAVIDRSR